MIGCRCFFFFECWLCFHKRIFLYLHYIEWSYDSWLRQSRSTNRSLLKIFHLLGSLVEVLHSLATSKVATRHGCAWFVNLLSSDNLFINDVASIQIVTSVRIVEMFLWSFVTQSMVRKSCCSCCQPVWCLKSR